MAFKSGDDGARRAHFTYVWAIENASPLSLTNKLLSPTFVVKPMEMTQWHLEAEVAHGTGRLTLSLCKEPYGCSEMFEIDFEFTLLGDDDHPLGEGCGTSRFEELGFSRWRVTFNEQEFCEQFPKETLTIRCRMWRRGCDISQYDLCFARTHIKVEKYAFVWAIKGFGSLLPRQNRNVIFHPTSESIPAQILTFCLQEKDGKEYGCVAVYRNKLTDTLPMNVKVFLLDAEGCSRKKEIRACPMNEERKVCEFSEFFEKEEITSNNADFLVNDVLSLRWEFYINVGPIWSRIENYRKLKSSDASSDASSNVETPLDRSEFHVCPYKDILRSLYEDRTLSDVSLMADYQYFSVHKNILGARSRVFKAMFTKDMSKPVKCFGIPDMSAGTLRRLLLYIYTNRVEELPWEGDVDLFRAASKYKLIDLREMCSNLLKAKISASNFCEMEELAKKHQDNDLQKIVDQFKKEYSGTYDCNTSKNVKIAN